MNVSTPTALVAAAPTLFRQGLLGLFQERWPRLPLTLTADAAQATALVAHRTFGLMVLDGTLPGLHLPALLDRLHRTRPAQRLLVLADTRTLAQFGDALARPGTRLLLPSHVPPHTLAAALAPWLDPGVSDDPARTRALLPPTSTDNFSPRELEVLRLMVDDHCNEEIAERLFLSVRTVESHRRNLIQKAGTRTLVGLAARAVREGWVA